jgi:hypothetical protein
MESKAVRRPAVGCIVSLGISFETTMNTTPAPRIGGKRVSGGELLATARAMESSNPETSKQEDDCASGESRQRKPRRHRSASCNKRARKGDWQSENKRCDCDAVQFAEISQRSILLFHSPNENISHCWRERAFFFSYFLTRTRSATASENELCFHSQLSSLNQLS